MGVRDVHVWKLAGDQVVASLHVQVQDHIDEQKVARTIRQFFSDIVLVRSLS